MIDTTEREGLEPHPEVLRCLEETRSLRDTSREKMRILDWGCGSGVAVECLRSDGWMVFGADIDARALEYGNSLIKDRPLALVDAAGRTPFPDGYFDFVYSQAVFEHVKDPVAAVREIRRVTKPGGSGFHVLPAPFLPIEPHIFVPIVHWLPKNALRWVWLLACLSVGIGLTSDVNKKAVQGMTLKEKVNFEYRYLNDQTYYRQYWQLGRAFRDAGFAVDYPVLNHRKLDRLRPLLARKGVRGPAQLAILTFVSIHIRTRLF